MKKTRLNMLFSPTLPAKTTQKVILKSEMVSKRYANCKASGGQVMPMPSIVNTKQLCKSLVRSRQESGLNTNL